MTEIHDTPLRKARLQRGLTLANVAKSVGSDTGNISRIQRGQQIPNRELLSNLVDLFKENEITEVHILYPERFNQS